MLLTTAGLYDLMSHAVSQRAQEIALHTALGAASGDVVASIVGHSLRLEASGLALGWTRRSRSQLPYVLLFYGVGPSDIATHTDVIAVTAMAALMSSWIPCDAPWPSIQHTAFVRPNEPLMLCDGL